MIHKVWLTSISSPEWAWLINIFSRVGMAHQYLLQSGYGSSISSPEWAWLINIFSRVCAVQHDWPGCKLCLTFWCIDLILESWSWCVGVWQSGRGVGCVAEWVWCEEVWGCGREDVRVSVVYTVKFLSLENGSPLDWTTPFCPKVQCRNNNIWSPIISAIYQQQH